MIAQELEVSLHMAFVESRQKRHEFITVEHLLLALLDNPTAAEVLRACSVDMDDLRRLLTDAGLRSSLTAAARAAASALPTWEDAADRFAAELAGLEPALRRSLARA